MIGPVVQSIVTRDSQESSPGEVFEVVLFASKRMSIWLTQ